jgi:hypothetical protein
MLNAKRGIYVRVVKVNPTLPSHLTRSSRSLTEAAPVYIYVLHALVYALFSGVLVYLYFVIKEDVVPAQKLSRYCHYTWPSMSTFICFIFFSNPRNPSALNTGVYFVLPAYLSLKGFGDSILGLGFKNAFYYQAAAMFLTLFYKVVKRARHFLSLMDDKTLELHSLNIFVKMCASMPPIMFLLFEAISCPMRYGNEKIGGAGFYDETAKEGCSDQRPGFDETFCQWAEWKKLIDHLKVVEEPGKAKRYRYFSELDGRWEGFQDHGYEDICQQYREDPSPYSIKFEVGKDWNYTTNGLPWAEKYVNWNFQEPCPLEMCDGVGIPNLVVILHLTGLLVYWIIFGFMYKDMTWDDIATLNPDKIKSHTLVQVVSITFASCISFFTFGTRSEDSTVLVADIEVYLLAGVLFLWAFCFVVQGLYLRSLHIMTEGNLEDIIGAFGSKMDEALNGSALYHTANASRARATSGLARFKNVVKKAQQNPSLAKKGLETKKSNRSSLVRNALPQKQTQDLVTRFLIRIDELCDILLRKYLASNTKNQIAGFYRFFLWGLILLPFVTVMRSIVEYPISPGHYWVYTVIKFFGVQAATILVNSSFTGDRWSDVAALASVPLLEMISLVRSTKKYFHTDEDFSAGKEVSSDKASTTNPSPPRKLILVTLHKRRYNRSHPYFMTSKGC